MGRYHHLGLDERRILYRLVQTGRSVKQAAMDHPGLCRAALVDPATGAWMMPSEIRLSHSFGPIIMILVLPWLRSIWRNGMISESRVRSCAS